MGKAAKAFFWGITLCLCMAGHVKGQEVTQKRQEVAWKDKTRLLPEKLRQIPDGLLVWDSPNPSYPTPDPATPGAFIWQHDTHVQAINSDLQMVEAGSFIWYSQAGWQANIELSVQEFAINFNCPNALLKKGNTYKYANNNRFSPTSKQLYGGDALWYVLAVDKAGKRYKGLAFVETEPGPNMGK